MRISVVQRCKSDSGSTLVEFSLVGFMFIIVLLGVFEMARMALVYTTVANAARVGTRYAIVHGADQTVSPSGPGNPCTCPQVVTVVKNFASAGLLNTANLSVTVNYPNGNVAGSPVTVTTSYTYDPFVTFFNSLLSTTMGSKSEGIIVF